MAGQAALYLAAGAELDGIGHMHDTSPAGLAASGGSVGVLVFPEMK